MQEKKTSTRVQQAADTEQSIRNVSLDMLVQRNLVCHHRLPAELSELRAVVSTKLAVPAGLKEEVTQVAEAAGIVASGAWEKDADWNAAWGAICKVWASMWTDRAW
jgi:hypothetical protein